MSDAVANGRPDRDRDGGPDASPDDEPSGWLHRLWDMVRSRNGEPSLRDAIEEIIEESERESDDAAISVHERVMLSNILNLRDLTADDVSVPRADIVAVDIDTGIEALIEIMIREGHSRLPVYRGTLDDVVGMVHIKDVLAHVHDPEFDLKGLVRTVLFVAPSMPAMDVLLKMRLERIHMALVVDEFGGIDGLLTIEDVVEEIVGEIEDEHDVEEGPKLVERPDGSLVADARMTIEEFEERVGPVLTAEEREEDLDTLGGLLAELAGRVPGRGELVQHASGITFEVLDADPRSVKRVRIRNAKILHGERRD
jgi:magnesium and cobalt transporter